jgi:pyruvate/2-oxoglutarate dehydrogenase complex dihydrolipoamide dehydrogenase (E3) component
MAQHFDLIVIGSGPAGRRGGAGGQAQEKRAGGGARAARGGVCVHTGTIPSKTLRETVLNLFGWHERGFYGRAHRNKDDITAEDLRRRLHIEEFRQIILTSRIPRCQERRPGPAEPISSTSCSESTAAPPPV